MGLCTVLSPNALHVQVEFDHLRGGTQIPNDAEIREHERGLAREAQPIAAPRITPAADKFRLDRDGFRDAAQRQIADNVRLSCRRRGDRSGDEGGLWEFRDVEKIGGAQMLVTFGVVRVYTRRVNFNGDFCRRGIFIIVAETSCKRVEASDQLTEPQMWDTEADGCMAALGVDLIIG